MRNAHYEELLRKSKKYHSVSITLYIIASLVLAASVIIGFVYKDQYNNQAMIIHGIILGSVVGACIIIAGAFFKKAMKVSDEINLLLKKN